LFLHLLPRTVILIEVRDFDQFLQFCAEIVVLLFSLCVQTGSGTHPASCPMRTEGSFPGGKARTGRDADHSPPSSAEVVNEYELYILSPCASIGVLWDCDCS